MPGMEDKTGKNNPGTADGRASPPATKAVAVERRGAADLPHITAKGHGYVAEKILDIAFSDGVKVRQDKDLVNLLDAFEVESPVPLEALHAVSLILERVYAANRQMADRSDTQTDTPETDMDTQGTGHESP